MQSKDQLEHYTFLNCLRVNRLDFYFEHIISHLQENPKITKLELMYGLFSQNGIEQLKQCRSVSSLTITGKIENADHLSQIANNNNIVELDLNACNIGNEGMRCIVKSKTIQKLYVSNCSISDDGVKEIASNKKIVILHISDNQISDKGAGYIIPNKSIKEIDISHNLIKSSEIIDKLKEGRRSVKSDNVGDYKPPRP